MLRTRLAGCWVLVFALLPTGVLRGEEFFVASWNLENLFDTEDDPQVKGDEEYLPDAAKQWNQERLGIKLKNLSIIVRKMNNGKGPDVLGVCEIENRKAVELLVERLKPLGRKYQIVHQDSPSARGIDCAIIFDAGVFSLGEAKFHHVAADYTRDIVEVRLSRSGSNLYVFMNHWPSRGHDPPFRNKAGDVARKRIDEILAAEPQADILLLGDFNDESTDESIREHLRTATTSENLPAGTMFDTTATIKEEGRGTFVYKNKWDMLDHIIVSPGMLDTKGFQWKKESSKTVDFPEQYYQPPYPGIIKRPSSSFSKDSFHKNGYSDHLPLSCTIVEL